MTFLDFVGHVGYALILLGLLLLGQKNIWGWVFRGIGEIIWIVIGFMIGMTSIWFWGPIFVVVDIRGYLRWRQAEEEKEAQ